MKRALLVVMVMAGGEIARAEVIDRILAVVDRAIITQSDVLAAMRLGLVPGQAATSMEVALDRLIQRRLELTEVDRYVPPEPADADVEKGVNDIRARFAPAEIERLLAVFGLTLDQLRRQVRDNLRIEAYLQQRFGSALQQPSDDDVLQHYQTHRADFTRGGTLRPFDEVQDVARAALIAERRRTQIQEWIDGLRRRADVNVLLNTGPEPVR